MLWGALELQQSSRGCSPGAVRWIEVWFSDCVYTPWEIAGFCVGLSSVFFWLIAQMPQFVSNFLRQSADALSPWFLFQWLAGDSLNLLGCLLTGDQLSTETFTAFYFIFADCLIISQFLYYQVWNRDRGYDFDESVHKPANGYQTAQAVQTTLKINPPAPAPPSVKPPDAISSTKGKQKHEPKRQNVSVHSKEFGVLARGERFQDFEEGKLHKVKATMKPVPPCHLRRQLRRVVSEYGLEYGPPSVSRISTEHAKRLSTIQLRPKRHGASASSSRLSKRGAFTPSSTLCMLGTLAMGTPTSQAASSAGKGLNRKFLTNSSSKSGRFLWVKKTGTMFGWLSAVLYLGSRVSQLIKNNQRKSAEGLSLAMVSCAVLANLTYGSAILMRAKSWEDLIGKAPWLVGSLGTVSLDITIFLQAQYLNFQYKSKTSEPDERTPLLQV